MRTNDSNESLNLEGEWRTKNRAKVTILSNIGGYWLGLIHRDDKSYKSWWTPTGRNEVDPGYDLVKRKRGAEQQF